MITLDSISPISDFRDALYALRPEAVAEYALPAKTPEAFDEYVLSLGCPPEETELAAWAETDPYGSIPYIKAYLKAVGPNGILDLVNVYVHSPEPALAYTLEFVNDGFQTKQNRKRLKLAEHIIAENGRIAASYATLVLGRPWSEVADTHGAKALGKIFSDEKAAQAYLTEFPQAERRP